jgi:hypothetical protein
VYVEGLTYEGLVDVGNDTTAGDGRLDERVQLLVSPKHDGFFTDPDPQAQSRQSPKLFLQPSESVLPTGPMFGRITQKEAKKKLARPGK